MNKVVEIIDNALAEAMELRSFIGLQADIAFHQSPARVMSAVCTT